MLLRFFGRQFIFLVLIIVVFLALENGAVSEANDTAGRPDGT